MRIPRRGQGTSGAGGRGWASAAQCATTVCGFAWNEESKKTLRKENLLCRSERDGPRGKTRSEPGELSHSDVARFSVFATDLVECPNNVAAFVYLFLLGKFSIRRERRTALLDYDYLSLQSKETIFLVRFSLISLWYVFCCCCSSSSSRPLHAHTATDTHTDTFIFLFRERKLLALTYPFGRGLALTKKKQIFLPSVRC